MNGMSGGEYPRAVNGESGLGEWFKERLPVLFTQKPLRIHTETTVYHMLERNRASIAAEELEVVLMS